MRWRVLDATTKWASPFASRRLERSKMAVVNAPPRIGIVTEAMARRPLLEVMDWLVHEAPGVTDLEIGSGGYAPPTHCDVPVLLHDAGPRQAWLAEIAARSPRVAALNAWGNPLHPDSDVARKHDADLRDSIRLAAAVGVNRIVAMAGC